MAISVYTGVMGSGKSYEAVLNGVLPAMKAGRRVVTNISGLSDEKCRAYLVERGCKADELGSVLVVTNEDVVQPGFFPGEATAEFRFDVPEWVPLRELQFYAQQYENVNGKAFTKTPFLAMLPELKALHERGVDVASCLVSDGLAEQKLFRASAYMGKGRDFRCELPDNGPSVVQPGDFVIIDEAWRYWSDQGKLLPEHMNFFRMHRHYVAANGTACDLLVLIQDFQSLHRFLRGVCELVMIFYKLKSLGWSSAYRVETYEGRPKKATLVSTSPMQKYRKDIFPLYKSYDGTKGKESTTDDRQNILKNRWFQFVMVAAIGGLLYSSWWFFGYVGRMRNGGVDSSKSAAVKSPSAMPGVSVSGPPGSAAAVVPGAQLPSDVRLVGIATSSRGETIAILVLPDGRIVRQVMSAGIVDGWLSTVGYQGKLVSFTFPGGKK
jgi:zona occludens toxin